MTLLEQIESRLKEAMLKKDAATASVMRMVKSKIQLKKAEPNFKGELNDVVVRDVIVSYYKQLEKAVAEYAALNSEQTAGQISQLKSEMALIEEYVPKALDEEATKKIVQDAIAASGATEPKHMGKVMGAVMAKHKGEVDPELVKKLATTMLGG